MEGTFFLPETGPVPPPSSPPSTVGRPKGLWRSPQSSALCVMQIAMQLYPQSTATWRCNPRLPSRACKFSSTLTAKAYGAAGQAAYALQDCDCSVTTAAFTTAAAWSWPRESGAARLRPCQACESPGQAASLRLHHSFPRRRAGWRIFCFLFVLFHHWLGWGKKLEKNCSFLFLLFLPRVPRGRGWQCTRHSLHTPVPLSFRQWAAGSGLRTRCLLLHPLPSHGAR